MNENDKIKLMVGFSGGIVSMMPIILVLRIFPEMINLVFPLHLIVTVLGVIMLLTFFGIINKKKTVTRKQK